MIEDSTILMLLLNDDYFAFLLPFYLFHSII